MWTSGWGAEKCTVRIGGSLVCVKNSMTLSRLLLVQIIFSVSVANTN